MTPTLKRRMTSNQHRRTAQLSRVWITGGWVGIGATLVLSLMPPTLGNDDTQLDKVVHLSGYAVLMFWWAQVVIERRWKLAVAVALFGVSIELLQGLTPHRMPDPLDALANTAGVLLGWMVARVSPNLPAWFSALPRGYR